MKLWQKLLAGLGAVIVVLAGTGIALYQINNQPAELREPNFFTYYQTQDTEPVGKVGIYISQMIMPEQYDAEFYENVFYKPLPIIPWPIRELVKLDQGTPLYDPNRYFEVTQFTPTALMDHEGKTSSNDGTPYLDLYSAGDIEFVPAQGYSPAYFVYKDQKAGIPTRAAELMAKARVYYHAPGAGLEDGRIPDMVGIESLANATMARLSEKYGHIPWRLVNTDKYDEARSAMRSLLDEGVETVVFAPPRVIYSHYEEFNASVRRGVDYIKEWEKEAGKNIKYIIAPQLADFEITKQAYLTLMRERLETLPKDSSVKIVMSIHGMPWELVENEAWLSLSENYMQGIQIAGQKMLDEFGFPRTQVTLTQDHFAEMTERYASTSDAFWKGIRDNYNYVINVPVEFITENTDTLFAHAVVNFRDFDEYSVYDTIQHTDWQTPYVRIFEQDGTKIIYNGIPVGRYNGPLVEAHIQSIETILDQQPQSIVQANR